MMSQHGEAAWAWVLSRPSAMRLLVHGEEAVAWRAGKASWRHLRAADREMRSACGRGARDGWAASWPPAGHDDGRRRAVQIGRTPELLGVVARHGDAAMEFILKHRFAGRRRYPWSILANPEPFLNGARDITKIVAENAIRPIADIPGEVAKEAAQGINWTLVFLICLLLGVAAFVGIIAFLPWLQKLVAFWLSGGGFRQRNFTLLRTPAAKPRPAVEPPASNDKPCNRPQALRTRNAANKKEGMSTNYCAAAIATS